MSLIIFIIFLAAGCKKVEFTWGQTVGGITYSGNVVFLGSNELNLLREITPDKLIFTEQKGKLSDITETSIILAGVSDKTPRGLLKSVNTIQSVNGELVIDVYDTSLPKAIKEGTVRLKTKLDEKNFYLKSKAEGVLVKGPTKAFDGLAITLDNLEIIKDGTRTARLNGAIGISPEIEISIIFKHNQIVRITSSVTLVKIDELLINSTNSFSGKAKLNAAEFVHVPIVIDSLVFVPEVVINTGYNGSVSSSLSTGVRQDRTITNELKFEDSKWTSKPLKESVNYDFIKPVLTDNSDLEIFSEPEVRLFLFGIPLQTITTKGYFSLKATRNDSPFWRLFIGGDGANTINSDILGLTNDYFSNLSIQPSEIGNSNQK